MASISTEKSTGHKRIWFVHPHTNRRRSIRLGNVSMEDAELVASHVASLVYSKKTGRAPDSETLKWLSRRPDVTDRFAEVGLIPEREEVATAKQQAAVEKTQQEIQLGKFLDAYFAQRKDVKASTQVAFGRVRRHLVGFFGEKTLLTEINAGHADNFRLYLQTEFSWKLADYDEPQKPEAPVEPKEPRANATEEAKAEYDQALTRYTKARATYAVELADFERRSTKRGLAENTIRRHIGYARQFFKVAVRRKLITDNPFIDLKAGSVATPARMYFVTPEEIQRVLAQCPSDEYRLIVALARYGGLRTPSETFALKWSDVDWLNSRIRIPSPKTAHHAGHESRMIPIFPELRPYLWKVWEKANPGVQPFVVNGFGDVKKNLRTRFERIIQRAGLVAWPRLFQNLRSSRETELAEKFPIQVVVAWLGNSVPVAKKHYLQVTEDHFAKALEPIAPARPGADSGAVSVQSGGYNESPALATEKTDFDPTAISPHEMQELATTGESWQDSEEIAECEEWAAQDSNL